VQSRARDHLRLPAGDLGTFGRLDYDERTIRARRRTLSDEDASAGIKNLERSLQSVGENEAAEIYNQAVDRANQRDYARAIALLEGLLPRVRNQELKLQIEGLLERFKKDAARLRQPVQ